MKSSLAAAALLVVASAGTARAQSFQDQDTLLTDAAAAPRAGTVRASVGGGGQTAATGGASSAALVSVLYTGMPHAVAGVQAYEQDGTAEPSALLRYQLLAQTVDGGVDVAVQGRYKKVGFASGGGEVEASVNVGRRWGGFDAVLNAVYGQETDGTGADAEAKASVGWSFTERLRLGLDARLQRRIVDGAADTAEADATVAGGRRFDLLVGPTVACALFDGVRVQALAGIGAPVGSTRVGPAGMLLASFDF